VRDEAAGIVERSLQEHLHFAAACALDPGAEQHVRLPGLIGKLGFVLGAATLERRATYFKSDS
jgi:hypothetical protein